MNDWLDLAKLIPGLKGQTLHVINAQVDPLDRILSRNGFSVFVINGSEIFDEASFFRLVKTVFSFPDYFGNNWDAWNDCLEVFGQSIKEKTAIIWNDADKSFAFDANTFLVAVVDLYNLATYIGNIQRSKPWQVELFLIGSAQGFGNILDFKKI